MQKDSEPERFAKDDVILLNSCTKVLRKDIVSLFFSSDYIYFKFNII